MDQNRCSWAGGSPAYQAYHDTEWGTPCHDDRRLFEFIVLEGAQAGLSWSTILNKREGYRRAFADWDAEQVAQFTPAQIELLLQDPGIVRNRLKVQSAVDNARAVLKVRRREGSLDAFLWGFVGGQPQQNAFRELRQVPAETATSQTMSKALKAEGFRFVGPTICYAFMQAVGMVNDHLVSCFRYRQLGGR